MARSYRNLWPRLVSWGNLLASYRKCRRRKRYRSPATAFDYRWEENLLVLQQELCSGAYQHGPYQHFHISDPKPRLISAAPFRDRVVHHAVVGVLEPLFERRFIHDSYACRVGKGTHRAIQRAQYYMRRHQWCLQTDLVKFFPSIDHEILMDLLHRRIGDVAVLNLLQHIIQTGAGLPGNDGGVFPGDDLFSRLRPRGLPIGNLTSQFLANVFLDPLDHFIKEDLRIPGYLRYADDLLLFGDSRQALWDAVERIRRRLADQRLQLHPQETQLTPTTDALTCLGFRVTQRGIRLSQQGIRRFLKRIRRQRDEFSKGDLDCSQIATSLAAWRAHLQHANNQALERQLIRQHLRFRRRNKRTGAVRRITEVSEEALCD